ncbi:MAG: cupin domain-containing protein [Hyphomicrobiales bacterium]
MSSTVRRVVTGHSEDGKAIIVSEGPVPVVRHAPLRPGYSMNEVWVTQAMPAVIDQEGEPTDRPRSVEPPRNGTVCRIIEFPPEASWIGNIDAAKAKEAFASLGSGHAVPVMDNPPHPLMHRTKTVDYGIVLSGEIYLVVDEGETLLKPGDVVVQRGTNHAWANRSDKPCRMAFVLIDGTWQGAAPWGA